MKVWWMALAPAMIAVPAAAQGVDQGVKADLPSLMTIYRDLHSHPELSMQESRSPALMAADKKVDASGPRLILTRGIGKAFVANVSLGALTDFLDRAP